MDRLLIIVDSEPREYLMGPYRGGKHFSIPYSPAVGEFRTRLYDFDAYVPDGDGYLVTVVAQPDGVIEKFVQDRKRT